MPYSILTTLWVSVAALLATVASGLGLWGADAWLRNHVSAALTSILVSLFAHTMTMFYFIGSGKKMKEFVQEWSEPERNEVRSRIVRMKSRIFPWMTFACVGLMAAFIAGGAAAAGILQGRIHGWIVYGVLLLHVHTVALETVYVLRNISFIHELSDAARRKEVSVAPTSA